MTQARLVEAAERKFYELSVDERIGRLRDELHLPAEALGALGRADPLSLDMADRLVENVVGVVSLPLGVARHFRIDGESLSVPMATEEPSVIAAASHGAKLLAAGGGIETEADAPRMTGQILLFEVKELEKAAQRLAAEREDLLSRANAPHPRLCAAGGGARGFTLRALEARPCGWMAVFELDVDVRDAMGANCVNSMCEAVAPRVAELCGGRVAMRILTNLCDRRLVRATGKVPQGYLGGAEGVRGIAEASLFAELDPYRACTHNKGVMNGIDAVLIATGQDFRAAEAGAHAYAARSGRYGPMAVWQADAQGDLVGRLEVPLAVGIVGARARVHPSVEAALAICGSPSAQRLACIAAAAGLAQNLAALRALSQEGIQRGHMALHRRIEEPRRAGEV